MKFYSTFVQPPRNHDDNNNDDDDIFQVHVISLRSLFALGIMGNNNKKMLQKGRQKRAD